MSRLAELRLLRARIDAAILAEEKKVARLRLGRPRDVAGRWVEDQPECGTEPGYQWHRRRKDPDCEPCRLAHRAHNRLAKPAAKRARRADSEVDPAVVERLLSGVVHPATPAERAEVVRRWGGSLAELERVTGWNVHRIVRGLVAVAS